MLNPRPTTMDDISPLFQKYHQHLVRYLARRLGDRDLADELAQETFVRAMRHLPLENARCWLFTVATNLVRDEARRDTRHRHKLTLLRNEAEMSTRERRRIAVDTPDIEEDADRTREIALGRAAVNALGERDRAALLLREEGLDYTEIAAALGLSVGSVGTTLLRAKRRLVDVYGALLREREIKGGADVA